MVLPAEIRALLRSSYSAAVCGRGSPKRQPSLTSKF